MKIFSLFIGGDVTIKLSPNRWARFGNLEVRGILFTEWDKRRKIEYKHSRMSDLVWVNVKFGNNSKNCR